VTIEEEELLGFEGTWSYLDTGENLGDSSVVVGAAGYGETDWKHPGYQDDHWNQGMAPLGYGGISGHPINTTIDFGPDLHRKHRTSYFRHRFQVEEAGDFDSLRLRTMRDDGAIVYLNGREVVRSGFDEGVTVTFQTLAATAFDEGEILEFQIPATGLVNGENVLAVEVHQASDGSSDLGFDLALLGQREVLLNDPVIVNGAVHVKARTMAGGEWSPLKEVFFVTGSRSDDLVVEEIMYHPAAGGAEFLELVNRGEVAHSLSDLRLTGGVRFDFSRLASGILGPGERLVLVRDREAFLAAYPGVGDAVEYEGALGNGGDRFSLETGDGEILWTVAYGDDFPWATEADGEGRSLVYRRGEFSNPSSWRVSVSNGGTPGASDSQAYQDGQDLMSYRVRQVVADDSGDLRLSLNLAADDADHLVEWSEDLEHWSREGMTLAAKSVTGGVREETWSITMAGLRSSPRFFRVRVRLEGQE
jgi:hypothetical protein